MSGISEPAFNPALLRVLEISYACDISRIDGARIPLGILADISAEGVYGLGLVARSNLSKDEADQIGNLIRAELSSPFTYLESIFDEVFKSSKHVDAFAELPSKHVLSLHFKITRHNSLDLPKPVKISHEARKLWVKDELHSAGNSAYWNMFGERVPNPVAKEAKEQLAA
jgi:hypothetical protein